MSDWIVVGDDELYHHGIQGQKWGQRNGPPYPLSRATLGETMRIRKKKKLQAQNAKIRKKNSALRKKLKEKAENKRLKERQRELKEENKKLRSAKLETKPKPQPEVKESKPVQIKPNGLSRRDIKKLSDEDLKKYIDRLNLEKQLYELDNQTMANGRREVVKILSNSGKRSVENVATQAMTGVGRIIVAKVLNSMTEDKELGDQIMNVKTKKKENKD